MTEGEPPLSGPRPETQGPLREQEPLGQGVEPDQLAGRGEPEGSRLPDAGLCPTEAVKDLDAKVEAAIRRLARDPEEEEQLRAAAKGNRITREWLLDPGKFSLSSETPWVSRHSAPQEDDAEPT